MSIDATDFLIQYGYIAIILFMFFKTSMTFPLLPPTEVFVPLAAAFLVSTPFTIVIFGIAATTGATIGSVFAYYLFGSTSNFIYNRYRSHVKISEAKIERSQHWFQRWGEGLVFWGRLLPAFRSLVSIPAGFAGMNLGRFILYSAGGAFLFATGIATIVYYFGKVQLPLPTV